MDSESALISAGDRTPERDAALLDGQRRVLDLLAHGAPLLDTLTALCEVIEKRVPQALCSILLVDSERGTLRHGAAPRLPREYCEAIDGARIGPAVGSCGTAAFEGRRVTVEDIATNALWVDYRAAALPHSLCACASIPIFDSEQQVLGTFAIYHTSAGPFDPGELAVLHDFTELATVVIETERRRVALAETEAALRQAQKLDSLGMLAGGIAHDFNNLLTAMLGNLNLAEMNLSFAAPAMPYLKNVEAAVLRAADLTKQMLAYSGKGRFVVKPVDISQVIDEMRHLLSIALPKKVCVLYDLRADLPLIDADVAQMQQVVMNLLTNAAEAIGDADGTVQIATGVRELGERAAPSSFIPRSLAPGRYVTLEVTDTGCGMSAEVMAKIFDPFFTTKKSGRGLGLSATLGILRAHHAGLEIVSQPGKGCTMELFFPVSQRAREAKSDAPRGGSKIVPRGLSLVVDDEPSIRNIAAQVLRTLGFEVLTAENGIEAIERVRARGAEMTLVLMDLTMPKLSGGEALIEIRKLTRDLPVILCSGYSEEDALQSLSSHELVSFLQKPYQIHELKQAVDAALRGQRRKPV